MNPRFIFRDQVGNSAEDLFVSRLTDGHTFQDFLDLQGKISFKPDWSVHAIKVDVEWDISTGEKRITYAFEEGEHVVFIGNALITGAYEIWPCYPIMVVEAAFE